MSVKYRKKPVVVEAIQWTTENLTEVLLFMNPMYFSHENTVPMRFNREGHKLTIHTLEGDMTCQLGNYIIRGVAGEYYPCREDIFNATYEKVEEEQS